MNLEQKNQALETQIEKLESIIQAQQQVIESQSEEHGKLIEQVSPPSDLANNPSVHSESSVLVASGTLLAFGLIIAYFITSLLKQNKSPELLLRLFVPVLLTLGSLYLVVVGFSNQHLAAIIGLVGTVVGFFLGRSSEPTRRAV